MSTEQAMLAKDALFRDLERYRCATDDRHRLMIMDRMVDTLCDLDPNLDLADAQTRVTELLRGSGR